MWRAASQDLGLRLEAPFRLALDSGETVVARPLVRDFGAANGMLIVANYSDLRPHVAALVAAGFGYSCLSEPSAGDEYDRELFVEMLKDWGWSGAEHLRPFWSRPENPAHAWQSAFGSLPAVQQMDAADGAREA